MNSPESAYYRPREKPSFVLPIRYPWEVDVTRFVLVPIIAAALTACVQPPRMAPAGMDRRQSDESPAGAVDQEVQPLHELIRQILRADYAGDRPALDRLYREADAFLGDKAVESRVRYWKGFAKWRRAINGANEEITPTDLAADVEIAAAELRRSAEMDPGFIDARIGEMQCLGLVLFFDRERR